MFCQQQERPTSRVQSVITQPQAQPEHSKHPKWPPPRSCLQWFTQEEGSVLMQSDLLHKVPQVSISAANALLRHQLGPLLGFASVASSRIHTSAIKAPAVGIERAAMAEHGMQAAAKVRRMRIATAIGVDGPVRHHGRAVTRGPVSVHGCRMSTSATLRRVGGLRADWGEVVLASKVVGKHEWGVGSSIRSRPPRMLVHGAGRQGGVVLVLKVLVLELVVRLVVPVMVVAVP